MMALPVQLDPQPRPMTAAEYAATPDETVLAVELHSTSTKRTDTVVKHADYADAGIGHYWMVDLLDGPSLTACHHGGPFGHVDAEPARGTFTADAPFPVRLELGRLG